MEIDIENKLRIDFKNNFEEAKKLLELFEDKHQLSSRVSRSIIKLSNGDINVFIAKMKEAEDDWRDVVEDAESFSFELNTPFKV